MFYCMACPAAFVRPSSSAFSWICTCSSLRCIRGTFWWVPAQRTVSGAPADLDFHVQVCAFLGEAPSVASVHLSQPSCSKRNLQPRFPGRPLPSPRWAGPGVGSVPRAPSTHALSCPVSPVHPGFGVCLPHTVDPLGSSRVGTGPPSHVHLLQALDPSVL